MRDIRHIASPAEQRAMVFRDPRQGISCAAAPADKRDTYVRKNDPKRHRTIQTKTKD